MTNASLVIMAAGIGARYGAGIKQLEPVGLNGELIIDYSIHDAVEAGFNRIIFVIRRDIEADFRERIGNRVESVCSELNVEVRYAFQGLDDIPDSFTVPEGRTKPWGTCQAVLSAKGFLDGPFMVINADDYYGKEIYKKLFAWLSEPHEDSEIAMAGFILKNTLSDNGGVTRGICKVDDECNFVMDITETKGVVKTAAGAEVGGTPIDAGSYVSMNMWAFPARVGEKSALLSILENSFRAFFETDVPQNPLSAECLLPVVIGSLLGKGSHSVRLIETGDRWFGMTYREDLKSVRESFRSLIESGIYGRELYWDLKLEAKRAQN